MQNLDLTSSPEAARGDELSLAADLVRSAGGAAMRLYGRARVEEKEGAGGPSPVTDADHAANAVLVEGLRASFPQDAILSEESRDSLERQDSERVWIIDPLDGTKEFLAQNGEFAVMLGLAIGGKAVLGAVYLPDGDTLYLAARGDGAYVERSGERTRLQIRPRNEDTLRLVGSRSHPDPLLVKMQEALGISDVEPCGSVGVKCARVAEGERDLYIHPVPYLKEWDTCAPEVVVREAGGWVGDCLGAPLRYNKIDPHQPHGMIACAPGVRERVLATVVPLYSAAGAAPATA
jgi:3'(2'), 5'-bisphosphate nucleotidase